MRDCDSSGSGRDILLTAMDRVSDAVLKRRGADVMAPLLDDLARLSAEHFATEERVLRRYGYTDLEARSAMHARLLKRIPDLQKRIRSGQRKSAGIANLLQSLSEQAGYKDRSAA
jgi:hemerythrin-like metal-binding protein